MPVLVVGVNHRTAPIEVRERFAYHASEVPAALSALLESGAAAEAVLLSTCNRTELYLACDDLARAEEAARRELGRRGPGALEENLRYLYARRDRAAVEHLFRVTAGLDSMIVGEPQIQGQVKEAYHAAGAAALTPGPAVGTLLNRLFQTALRVGGRVRSETDLGRGAASVSTAAVELAKKIFGSLQDRRALVLGAGEMSEATLECLLAEGVRGTLVANRTLERATELAERWCGRAIPWDQVGSAMHGVDIVLCSTAAPHPVLTLQRMRESLPHGAARPLCIIDIAIPRDVEPSVGDEPNVFLYNIDDLQQIVDVNLGRRRAELPRAEAIVAEGVEEFWSWYAGLAVVPTIRDLRARGEELRQAELERALRRLGHLAAEDQEAIEQMTRQLLNKLLHTPTVRLREAAGNGRGTGVLDTVRYLFELDASGAASPGDVPADSIPTPPVAAAATPSPSERP